MEEDAMEILKQALRNMGVEQPEDGMIVPTRRKIVVWISGRKLQVEFMHNSQVEFLPKDVRVVEMKEDHVMVVTTLEDRHD